MTANVRFYPSFYVFWILTAVVAIYCGGLLNLAFVGVALLMVFCHERAHATYALEHGAVVQEIGFTWLGGYVLANFHTLADWPGFFMAGVKNTCAFAVTFIALNYSLVFYFYQFVDGFNFATNPYLNLLDCLVVFSVLMAVTMLIPGSYHWKAKDILITTDAWAAVKSMEPATELFNDGKIRAVEYSTVA